MGNYEGEEGRWRERRVFLTLLKTSKKMELGNLGVSYRYSERRGRVIIAWLIGLFYLNLEKGKALVDWILFFIAPICKRIRERSECVNRRLSLVNNSSGGR